MTPQPLPVLTVQQPWAGAIAAGWKPIENRSWPTAYRGLLGIHAGLRWSRRGADDPRVVSAVAGRLGLSGERWDDARGYLKAGGATWPTGVVVAVAELVDVHPDAGCCRPWGEAEYVEAGGRRRTVIYHWCLENIRALAEPVPCLGRLGLWTLPAEVAAEVWLQLERAA
jgi:hypothetical protein